MNALGWLLIGHLVGDWLLQNDWMAKGKKRGLFNLAGVTHFAIYTTSTLAALWLSGVSNWNLAIFLSLSTPVFASQWLIDSTNIVERWMQIFRQTDLELVRVMVDQTVHLLVLVLLTAFLCGK